MDILKRITIIFCFFLSFSLLKAQFVITKQLQDRVDGKLPKEQLDSATYRCIYHFTQKVKNRETQEMVLITDTMALDIGSNFSVYYDRNKAFRDSISQTKITDLSKNVKNISINYKTDMAEYKEVQGSYDITSYKGESAKVYKNRRKKELTTIDITPMEVFKCVEQVPFQNWELTTDTLTVLGYLCQKATTFFRGRNYEAWFTPEIPVKDGPWKLYGLPGLILKAVSDDNFFVFEAIGLKNIDNNKLIMMDKDMYIKCSNEELIKLKAERRKKRGVRHVSRGNATMGSTQNPFEFTDIEVQ